jgi:hypothetical protein
MTDKKVQIDLILAENDTMYIWRYHWYASPKSSDWKGAARNILIGLIAHEQGYSWTKSGLYAPVKRQDIWGSSEEKELVTIDPNEACKLVFKNAQVDTSITESVETMMQWLEHEGANIKSQVLSKFNSIVAEYESEGREMKNKPEEVK